MEPWWSPFFQKVFTHKPAKVLFKMIDWRLKNAFFEYANLLELDMTNLLVSWRKELAKIQNDIKRQSHNFL